VTDKTDQRGDFETRWNVEKRSSTLDRMWRENSVSNSGLKQMRSGYEVLVAKGEWEQLEHSGI